MTLAKVAEDEKDGGREGKKEAAAGVGKEEREGKEEGEDGKEKESREGKLILGGKEVNKTS